MLAWVPPDTLGWEKLITILLLLLLLLVLLSELLLLLSLLLLRLLLLSSLLLRCSALPWRPAELLSAFISCCLQCSGS